MKAVNIIQLVNAALLGKIDYEAFSVQTVREPRRGSQLDDLQKIHIVLERVIDHSEPGPSPEEDIALGPTAQELKSLQLENAKLRADLAEIKNYQYHISSRVSFGVVGEDLACIKLASGVQLRLQWPKYVTTVAEPNPKFKLNDFVYDTIGGVKAKVVANEMTGLAPGTYQIEEYLGHDRRVVERNESVLEPYGKLAQPAVNGPKSEESPKPAGGEESVTG